jgi:uncharacterized protein YegL
MVGENIKNMEHGLQSVVATLCTDPHALETVHVSVIAFAGIAKTIVPLIEVSSFYLPKLPLGGGTSLGAGLNVLMSEIDNSVVRSTPDAKGDWKPIVYLFTDGQPTDDPMPEIARWNAKYAHRVTLIAVGLGKGVDFSILKKLTENVVIFENTKESDFTQFVRWISSSVVAQSKSVGESLENIGLPALDDQVVKIVKDSIPAIDGASVTLVGRCQKTHKPYIIKYDREIQEVTTRDFKLDVTNYLLSGCYPLEESYFAWTDNKVADLKVNTESLINSPGCPHCGNGTAFAVCECGKLLCINGPGEVACPWCEKSVIFGSQPQTDEGGFNVTRGRG